MSIILGPQDGPAFERYNEDKQSRYLLIADHARNRVPECFGDLGIRPQDLNSQIGYDPGSEGIARHLSDLLQAPLLMAGFSRLVLDPNRIIGDTGQIPVAVDGIQIPANHDLTEAQKQARIDEIFTPYQGAIGMALDNVRQRGETPVLLSIHTFTPQLNLGTPRPWHVGILWRQDERLSRPLINALEARGDMVVGDNEPYDRRAYRTQSVEVHGEDAGIPNVLIEVRQDLVTREENQKRWAEILFEALPKDV